MTMSTPANGKPSLMFRIGRRLGGEIDYTLMLARGAAGMANKRSLRIFAQRRSGHHAVLNWIRYQLGRHYFLNDCRPGLNPFAGAQITGSSVQGLFGEHRVMRTEWEQRRRFTWKGTLLYNFEEYDIRQAARDMPLHLETQWIGRSIARHDVLIIRDPFNLLASKLRWAYSQADSPSRPTIDQLDDAKELWKVYAREYLGMTAHLSDTIPISYNHWFTSREYRDEVAGRFDFINHDRGIDEVAKWGPTVRGGSFDGLKYEGRAREMKVLERWKEFINDPVYRRLTADAELHELSTRIFGEIAGVDALRVTAV